MKEECSLSSHGQIKIMKENATYMYLVYYWSAYSE